VIVAAPFVSVVIPTFNRKDSLLRTLDSLNGQTYSAHRYEVIVVDDGGDDGTGEIVNMSFSFPLRCFRQPNQGDAIARNFGALQSRAELLVFLDDDIVVEPEFIAALVEEHRDTGPLVAVGTLHRIAPEACAEYGVPPLQRPADKAEPSGPIHFTQCLSGILSIRRDSFLGLGLMQPVADEGSSVWCDVEFGYRAHLQGFRFVRSAEAVGYHYDATLRNLETSCRRWFRAARAAVSLFEKHPGLAQFVPMFRDKAPVDWRQDPPGLIARKLARTVVSASLALQGMERLVAILETHLVARDVLRHLYRWIGGGYIYRGYRDGLQNHGHIEKGDG